MKRVNVLESRYKECSKWCGTTLLKAILIPFSLLTVSILTISAAITTMNHNAFAEICNIAGHPSCYSMGFAAGHASLGTSYPSKYSFGYCAGYITGSGGKGDSNNGGVNGFADPPCNIAGHPSCYSMGFAAGHASLGTSCPSKYSFGYCAGYSFGSGKDIVNRGAGNGGFVSTETIAGH